jgi:hypothetical protein
LSVNITPDSSVVNPDGVITLSTSDHLLLTLVSSVLFVIVLLVFTKVVLVDHKEEFGINSWKQGRVFITVVMTTSFISLVYILLDISLINIYLMTLPTIVAWNVQFLIPSLDAILPDTIDRLSYGTIRGYYFVLLLGFMFLIPLTMFVSIFTRFGRKTIQKQTEKERKLPAGKLVFGLITSGVFTAICFYGYNNVLDEILSAVLLFISLGFAASTAVFAFLFLINAIRFTVFLTYSNFLLVFPFIFIFYLLPAGLWGLWDIVVVVTSGGIENTIYAILPQANPAIDPLTASALDNQEFVQFYLQTVTLNLTSIIRIIQLDFIIVVGLSALVIGFAEGFSILSIIRGITRGVSIAKTGKVASQSAPKIVVITSRLFYLGAWLSFLWDNLVVLGQALVASLNLDIDFFELPQFLNIVIDFSFNLGELSSALLVLTILAVPFYFILTSSFKFLSVSLVLEKVRDDKQIYYLLISSAYILIVTNIFADIASLPEFLGTQKQFLPLAGAATEDLLPFVAKIFEILESIAFYAGLIATVIYTFKNLILPKKQTPEMKTELQ